MSVLSVLSAVQSCLPSELAHGCVAKGFKTECILFLDTIENSFGGLDRLCPMFSVLSAAYQSLLLTSLEWKQEATSNWQISQKI